MPEVKRRLHATSALIVFCQRIPGSTLIAANAPKPFQAILAAELDPALADALATRLKATPAASIARVFAGNCNDSIEQIVQRIPARALTLGFVDPEAMNVDFETVRKLSERGRVDLLILLADRMDLASSGIKLQKRTAAVRWTLAFE